MWGYRGLIWRPKPHLRAHIWWEYSLQAQGTWPHCPRSYITYYWQRKAHLGIPGAISRHIKWQTKWEDCEKSHPRDDKLGAGGPLWPRGLLHLASTMLIEKFGLVTKHLKMRDFQISRFSWKTGRLDNSGPTFPWLARLWLPFSMVPS